MRASVAVRKLGGRQRGLTRLEFAVCAAIVATLAGIYLGVVLYYEELGEKTEVQLTILNIRAGLRYQLADRMMNGRMNELPGLSAVNPVNWLERPPAGYAGERVGDSNDPIGRGQWCFDLGRRELQYRPRLRGHLSPDLPLLRWRIVPISAPGKSGAPESLALVDVEPYRWF